MKHMNRINIWKQMMSFILSFTMMFSYIAPGAAVMAEEFNAEPIVNEDITTNTAEGQAETIPPEAGKETIPPEAGKEVIPEEQPTPEVIERDIADQTANTKALKLALEKVSYPTKDVEKKDVTVDVAVKDNTIDLSKIDPTLLKTPDLTLAFNLLAFGEDGIKRGDTFVLNLPKNAEDKPFFILTDTAIDQPLIAGKDDKAVQIGAYTIKNNVLTATFDGAAEGLADDNRNGEISLKTALNATLLSADTPTKVDFNLQNVKVDDALKVTEADVTTATRTVLLPKKTPKESAKESAKDENSKNPAEPTPEAEKPSE
ncbi:MAG: hypothetical protein RR841_10465, partial [Eubacterium sp.]